MRWEDTISRGERRRRARAATPDSAATASPSVSDDLSVPAGTVAEIEAWVGGDPERAALALAEELSGKARKSLIASLAKIVEA